MGGVSRGEISGKTRLLALIGHPVTHSLSPAMHNASFAEEGLDFVYVCLDVAPDELPAAVLGLEALKFRGFNVTMPHKRAMIPLVDELDEGARISGAVNTVVIEASKTRGYNTDGGGMVKACAEAGIELSGKNVLLLGSGGTAAAIAVAFYEAGIGELHIANRSIEHATRLRDKLNRIGMRKLSVHPLEAPEKRLPDADVVVNATPLGMKVDDPMPLPPDTRAQPPKQPTRAAHRSPLPARAWIAAPIGRMIQNGAPANVATPAPTPITQSPRSTSTCSPMR